MDESVRFLEFAIYKSLYDTHRHTGNRHLINLLSVQQLVETIQEDICLLFTQTQRR